MLWSQQSTQYSMYMHNPFAYNPAYGGMENTLSFTGVYRKQWVNLDGSPASQNVSVHLPFGLIGGGFGININNDVIGAHRNTKASLSYSYNLLNDRDRRIAVGGSLGIIQQAFDWFDLRAPEGSYEANTPINHNDDFLAIQATQAITPTAGIGIYYKAEYLEAGVAVDNLLENKFQHTSSIEDVNILTKRHFYLFAKYQIDIGETIQLAPSILAKSDLVETQTDVSLVVWINQSFFVGGSYRGFNPNSFDSVVIMAGTKFSGGIGIGYSFDYSLSKLQTVTSGSHEIMISYNLGRNIGLGKLPPIIYNPRNL